MDNLVLDPNLPYVGPIGSGGRFTSQKLVRITGTVPAISYRFNINLQCGPCTSPQDDIALQISVRLLDGCIWLNSLHRGIWDESHKKTEVPIKSTERFEIVISCEFSKYKVAINGQQYCEFPQRIHYDKISHLSIDGDVSIIKISYESAGEGSTAESLLPTPVASRANENDDFEVLDNATSATFNDYRPPPPKPPSELLPPSSGPQQPTSGFYLPPTAGFLPPNNSYPSTNPPTYEEALSGSRYPTGAPIMHPQPMQPTYVSGLRPPPGTTIPLNAVGSSFRPVKRNSFVKVCCIIISITVAIVFAIAFLLMF